LWILLQRRQLCCSHRNQRKKKALADTKDAYNKLLSDNTALLKQLQDTQRDSYAVTEHFRKEVLGKNERIAELQGQVEQVCRHQHPNIVALLTWQLTCKLLMVRNGKAGSCYDHVNADSRKWYEKPVNQGHTNLKSSYS
jgi:hypothetical protein